jgi:DNA repair exonuclease SbcCD ATPase subunit
VPERAESVEEQIAAVKQQLADARARVPNHDVPAALVQEIDELDEELARLRSLAKRSLEDHTTEVRQKLREARKRIPKHTPPPGLMAEIDELEEELLRLESQRPAPE